MQPSYYHHLFSESSGAVKTIYFHADLHNACVFAESDTFPILEAIADHCGILMN